MRRSLFVCALVLMVGCGGTSAVSDAAPSGDAVVPSPDADSSATEDSFVVDASESFDAAELAVDAAMTEDITPPPMDVVADVSIPDTRSNESDVVRSDVLAEAGAIGRCPVPDLLTLYPGFLPTNPYAPRPTATPCIAAEHDVIIVLGCPNNADGTPASCQTQRADMAVALSRAGYGSWFITSGAAVHNSFVEADTLAQLLMARGIPGDRIVRERQARHTDENIYYSSRIMQMRSWSTALMVSEDPGHLIMTAVCDSNCCVNLGRLTIFDFPVAGRMVMAGHYALIPPAAAVSSAECMQIQLPTKVMCVNLSNRNACAGRLRL